MKKGDLSIETIIILIIAIILLVFLLIVFIMSKGSFSELFSSLGRILKFGGA